MTNFDDELHSRLARLDAAMPSPAAPAVPIAGRRGVSRRRQGFTLLAAAVVFLSVAAIAVVASQPDTSAAEEARLIAEQGQADRALEGAFEDDCLSVDAATAVIRERLDAGLRDWTICATESTTQATCVLAHRPAPTAAIRKRSCSCRPWADHSRRPSRVCEPRCVRPATPARPRSRWCSQSSTRTAKAAGRSRSAVAAALDVGHVVVATIAGDDRDSTHTARRLVSLDPMARGDPPSTATIGACVLLSGASGAGRELRTKGDRRGTNAVRDYSVSGGRWDRQSILVPPEQPDRAGPGRVSR